MQKGLGQYSFMLGLSCTSGLAPIKKKLSIAIILLLSLEHGLLGFRGVMQRSFWSSPYLTDG